MKNQTKVVKTSIALLLVVVSCIVGVLAMFQLTKTVSATAYTLEPTSAVTAEKYDLTGDGVVNVLDYTILKSMVLNGNTDYDISDCVVVKKFLLGISSTNTTVSISKPAVEKDFSAYPVSQEDSEIIRNLISNYEISSLDATESYVNIDFETENTLFTMCFSEGLTVYPDDATIVVEFAYANKYYAIFETGGNYKISLMADIGKAISIVDCSKVKASDAETKWLEGYQGQVATVAVETTEIAITFEDDTSIFEMTFPKCYSSIPADSDVVLKFKDTNSRVYGIWIDADGYYQLTKSISKKFVSGITLSEMEVTDSTSQLIRNWLSAEGYIVNFQQYNPHSDTVVIHFEDEFSCYEFHFSEISTEAYDPEMVIASSRIGNDTVVIWTDGYAYHLSLQ